MNNPAQKASVRLTPATPLRVTPAVASRPIVVFDLETGGLEPGKHPIIQIAAIAVDAATGWSEISSFERKLTFDPATCEAKALEVNHWSEPSWADAVAPLVALRDFAAYLERYRAVELISTRTGRPYRVARVAGYNCRFDLDHISAAFKATGLFFPGAFATALDVMQGVVWGQEQGTLAPTKDMKLTTVAAALGVEVAGTAHDALVDVRLTIGVARRVLGHTT